MDKAEKLVGVLLALWLAWYVAPGDPQKTKLLRQGALAMLFGLIAKALEDLEVVESA